MEENLNNNQQPEKQEQVGQKPKKQEPSAKTKKKKAKAAVITLSTIIVLVLGLQIYAATNGYGNVFFMIRDWTTSKNASGDKEVFYDKNSNKIQEENSNVKNEVKYEISKKSNTIATIKATKNGKTVTKDFTMTAEIADIGTMELTKFGKVALIAESGGEYYGVNVYQLVDNEIKKIGNIDCGADMVKDATYIVKTKGEGTVVIDAKNDNYTITKEIEMTAAIDFTEVLDVLKCGKVVLVAETGGEYYAIKAFRVSQDYTNGKLKEIKEVGTIKPNTEKENTNVSGVTEKEQQPETDSYSDFFEKNANIQYDNDLTNSKNGKAAIIKSGEGVLKTTQNNGYYTYTDMWNNSYNIKKIKDVKSEFIQLGKDKQSALYKCTIYYMDNNNQDKSFDVAVIVAKDAEGGIAGTFDSYTGSTSYTRWSGLYDEGNTENNQLEPDNYADEVMKDEVKILFSNKLKKDNENNTEKLLDYKVERVEILSDKDKKRIVENDNTEYFKNTDTLAVVTYSVKPRNINNTEWTAGNGELSGDWIINKTANVCVRNGDIVFSGTGW